MSVVAWAIALLIALNVLLTAALWIVRAGERPCQPGHGERDTGHGKRDTGHGESDTALAELERVR